VTVAEMTLAAVTLIRVTLAKVIEAASGDEKCSSEGF
jgi:hypothetical protein